MLETMQKLVFLRKKNLLNLIVILNFSNLIIPSSMGASESLVTVDKEFECFFDISEFKEYPYLAFNAKTCYVNKDGDQYFCLEIPYIILPISSWG